MIVADLRDDGQFRYDDIGAVQSAAQPYFYDGDIYFFQCEVFKGHGHCDFEEGGIDGLGEGADAPDKVYDEVFPDHLPVHLYPFPEILQVWGCVQPCLIPGFLKDGGQHMTGRPFPVCPCDMDGREFVLRVADIIAELDRVEEVLPVCSFPDSTVHGELAEDVF